ncbi:MAG: histidinol-phosphate transaminase [Saprospiraceae bacterium]|nr:histidinol-phosphate transaminase [Saprospiraceae bacterium]
MNINALVRPNILKMKAYSSARDEFKGAASVFLDANENPYPNDGLNRYPDPLAMAVKREIAKIKGVDTENIFLGNGSDEVIDVLIRIFCEPRVDNIITLPPTYGMYQVSADTCDVAVKTVPLTVDFQPKVEEILREADEHSKILFICSPNNPTANNIEASRILNLLNAFKGIVVVDEAYIDFSTQQSCIEWISTFPNLVVMQTFSKAWGMAGIRLGMAFGSKEVIDLMNKVKPPYNVNELTQRAALDLLKNKAAKKDANVKEILAEREKMAAILRGYDFVEKVYPSDANFILVKIPRPNEMYQWLLTHGIVVRNRHTVTLCEGCLRITVGTPEENRELLRVMKESQFLIA